MVFDMALPAEEPRYTFADALAWGEDERIEIIDGEAFMMAPPSPVQQEISVELATQLRTFLRGKRCKVYPAPFAVRLFEEEGDRPDDVDTMVEPDITVVCDPERVDRYGYRGAPDLVIEILSPSTRRHDLTIKYQLYQRAGVREYWIVDPVMKVVNVHLLEDGLYNAPEAYTAGAKVPVSLWEGFRMDLSMKSAERGSFPAPRCFCLSAPHEAPAFQDKLERITLWSAWLGLVAGRYFRCSAACQRHAEQGAGR